jgi:hypothetical protein
MIRFPKVALRRQRYNLCKAESLKFPIAVNINIIVICNFGPCSLVDALLRNVPIHFTKLRGVSSLNTS